ncbi:MAG: hypothetical protein KIS78_19090, partial [Labilithrix sp.]|nr:hypothetical protein [Labilithrix sp.]
MGRPATGSARWLEKRKLWIARVTMPSGERKPVSLRGVPPCEENPSAPDTKCTCPPCAQAKRIARQLSAEYRDKGAVPADAAETVTEWYGRYYKWREGRGRGAESVSDSRGRFNKWIEPKLGTLEMVRVTRDDLERFAEYLDEQAADEVIAPKTAVNIWGEITVGFAFAKSGHNKFG